MKGALRLTLCIFFIFPVAGLAQPEAYRICTPGASCTKGCDCSGTSTICFCDGSCRTWAAGSCYLLCTSPLITGVTDCASGTSRKAASKQVCSGTLVGDPVDLNGRSGLVDRLDVSSETPAGRLEVWRTLSTNRLAWFGNWNSPFLNLPKLFGETVAADAPYWKLNWTALAQVDSGRVHVWASNGARLSYVWSTAGGSQCQGVESVPRRLTPLPERKVADELFCLSPTEFILLRGDGTRERFASQYGTGRIFLTDVVNEAGVTVASLSYGQPRDFNGALIVNCPAAGSGYVPYLTSISGQSTYLEFRYTTRGSGGALVCVLSEVRLGATAASASPVVRYGYQLATTESVAPLNLASVYQGATVLQTEGYSNVAKHVGVARVFAGTENVPGTGTPLRDRYAFSLPASSLFVDSATASTEALGIGIDGGNYLVTQANVEAGDLSSTPVTRVETHVLASFPESGGVRRATKTVTCSALQSCSPGTEAWSTTSYGSTNLAFSVTPAFGGARVSGSGVGPTQVDGGTATSWYVKSSHDGVVAATDLTGLNTPGNCKGLECEWYGWTRAANNQVKLSTSTRNSVLMSGATVATTQAYYPSGQLKAVIDSGYTKRESGVAPVLPNETKQLRYRGTFYLTTRTASANCLGGADSLGRIVEVHGPCDVSGPSASDCAGTYPLTQYLFHDAAAAQPADRLRMSELRRFPAGCASAPIRTQYSNYDAFGRPQAVTDESLTTTSFTFDADGHVLTRTVGSNAWTFRYVTGRLRSITYPEGNSKRFCYQASPSFSGTTTYDCPEGTTAELDRPTLVVKARTAVGPSEWSEAAVFTVHPVTKNVTGAAFYTRGEAAPRRELAYGNDAESRRTSSREGLLAGDTTRQRFFEGELRQAVGAAFNAPPAFCWDTSSNAVSTSCTRFEYDAARRLTRVVTPQASGPDVETRLVYNTNGNLCDSVAGTSGLSCDAATARANGESNSFEYDDFGNVLAAWTTGAVDGAQKGGVRLRYDAFGNTTLRQTTQQALNSVSTTFAYDAAGRRTSVVASGTTPTTLYSFAYDSDQQPCGLTQANIAGRLSSETGPMGTTYFSYDSWGHVAWERLVRTAGQCMGLDTSPQTSFTWSPSGTLQAIGYPHGLTVEYRHGLSGLERKDRVEALAVSTDSPGVLRTLVSDVTWEPFAGLRYYKVNTVTGPMAVEQVLGDTSVAPGVNDFDIFCPTMASIATNSPRHGRAAGLFVSTGLVAPGAGTGDLLKLRYTWRADQLTQVTSCVVNSRPDTQLQTYQYDRGLRLTRSDFPRFAASGGPHEGDVYTLDRRGNRLTQDVTGHGDMLTSSYGTAMAPDRVTTVAGSPSSSLNRRSFSYDADGRVVAMTWPNDSSGQPTKALGFGYLVGGGAADSAIKEVDVESGFSSLTYQYVYDADNRRRAKVYPSGERDEYFWLHGTQLLEDRGWRSDGATARRWTSMCGWRGSRSRYGAAGSTPPGCGNQRRRRSAAGLVRWRRRTGAGGGTWWVTRRAGWCWQ